MTVYRFKVHPLPEGQRRVTQLWMERPGVYQKWNLAGHNGIDFGAPTGTPLYAPLDGIVKVGVDPTGFGNYVKIFFDLGHNITGYVLLAHMQSVSVVEGQRVEAGTQVGTVGNTGASDGSHLHLGVKLDFVAAIRPVRPQQGWVNPAPFFDVWRSQNEVTHSVHWMAIHREGRDDQVVQRQRPNVIKIINPNLAMLVDTMKRNPSSLFDLRDHPMSEQHAAAQAKPVETATEHIASWAKFMLELEKQVPDARERCVFEGINEWEYWLSGPKPFVTYNLTFADLAAKNRLRVVACNLGVGWPGNDGVKGAPPNFKPLAELEVPLVEGGHYWGSHNYFTSAGWAFCLDYWGGAEKHNPYRVARIQTEQGLDEATDPSRIPHIAGNAGTGGGNETPAHQPQLGYGSGRDLVRHDGDLVLLPADAQIPFLTASSGGGNTRGFRGYGTHRWYVEAQLIPIEAWLRANVPFLFGVCWFTFDFAHPWSSFDVLDEAASLLADHCVANPKRWVSTMPRELPTTPPMPPTPVPPSQPKGPTYPAGAKVETSGTGVRLRRTPSTSGEIITVLALGTVAVVLPTPAVIADGWVWQEMQVDRATGWAATAFFQPVAVVKPTPEETAAKIREQLTIIRQSTDAIEDLLDAQ